MQEERFSSRLTRVSEGGRYEVSEEDPDPRGWTVVANDGSRVGKVTDLIVDPAMMKVRYFEVEVDDNVTGDDGRVLVDAQQAELDESRQHVRVEGVGADALRTLPSARGMLAESSERHVAADRGQSRETTDAEHVRMTRSEEELRIGKREVETGELIVNKSVETEQVRQPIERRVERVRVERRPVTETRSLDVEIHNDELRVPIVEEEIVVEKRPVVKEEIVIRRDVDTETEVVEEEVRKERIDVHEEGKGKGGRHGRH